VHTNLYGINLLLYAWLMSKLYGRLRILNATSKIICKKSSEVKFHEWFCITHSKQKFNFMTLSV